MVIFEILLRSLCTVKLCVIFCDEGPTICLLKVVYVCLGGIPLPTASKITFSAPVLDIEIVPEALPKASGVNLICKVFSPLAVLLFMDTLLEKAKPSKETSKVPVPDILISEVKLSPFISIV